MTTTPEDVVRFIRDKLDEDVLKGDSMFVDVFATGRSRQMLVDCGDGDMFEVTVSRVS